MRPRSGQAGESSGTSISTNASENLSFCGSRKNAALAEGRIAGAGLDVLDAEPPFDPDLPILHAPNTVIAPHIGFSTQEALDERARMAIDHVREFLGL